MTSIGSSWPAFYENAGVGRFHSTGATAGPWSADFQHAGPPCGLLGRAMQQHDPRDDFRVSRMTCEILRPIPIRSLDVAVEIVRGGRQVELLQGSLSADGQVVMLARAWRMKRSPASTPTIGSALPPARPASESAPAMSGANRDGYLSAMEWRFVRGTDFDSRGPGAAWARQLIPLVAGEDDTPLTRALVLADSNWAVGFELDHDRQLVINTDMTLALHRDPIGEWFYLSSTTAATSGGSGVALGTLDDERGSCARVLQSLLIAER